MEKLQRKEGERVKSEEINKEDRWKNYRGKKEKDQI